MKKPKRTNLKKLLKRLRNKCKKLWRQAVLRRWDNKCIVCGEKVLPNCHHIVPKEMFGILRYDPVNGVVLCPRHHKFGKFSAHKNPLWFVDILISKMTTEELNYLKRMMNEPTLVFNVAEYQKILDKLEGLLNIKK